MNIIESLRKVESRIFADRNESVNLVDMYLTNSKNIDKAKLQEMLENDNTNGVIKLLNKANRKSLKEDYYTVKYAYYTDDDQIELNSVTFDNAQDAKDLSDNLKKSLKGNLIHLDWDIEDENTTRDWELIDKKTITDFDGFDTEYSLWKKIDEDYWVCVFGDSDIYGPEDGEFDAEFDTEREAQEWFDNYNGFEDELDESLKEGDEHLHQLYKLYWDIVKASKEFDPWHLYDYIFSVIKNKDYADNFKKAVKPLSDDELGEMDSEQVIDHIFDCISGEDYELQFSQDFMSGLWDYFPESLDKKNLKEGHWSVSDSLERVYVDDEWDTAPSSFTVGSDDFETFEDAVDFADKNGIDTILYFDNAYRSKPSKQWKRDKDSKFNFDTPFVKMRDGSWKKRVYQNGKPTYLDESLKEYIDSTILSDQTLSMLEEGDHLVDGNEDWQILEIEVRGNRYLPKRERVSLHLIGKNGIKKYTSAGALYGYKIVEKSDALGENLKEDWEDENHGTSDKKASMKRVEKFVDLVGGDLKSTKDGGAIITWDGGKIVAKGLQDLFSKVEKAYKKMQKSMKEDIDWSKSFATMSDEEIRKEIAKMNEKSDKEYLQDYLDYFNAIYKQEDGKHIIELPYDEDIVEDSFEDLMYDVKYNLHEMSLDGSL